jgi:UDP-3-O-[3-hydroxymyristoyl] glucosamine N-acyltransferase
MYDFLGFSLRDLVSLDRYKISIDNDFKIKSVSSISNPRSNSLMFLNKVDNDSVDKINKLINCVILLKKDTILKDSKKHCLIWVDNPRFEYAFILNKFIKYRPVNNERNNCNISDSAIIEPYVVIEENVSIGENCIIRTGVVIKSNVSIGDRCVIKENSVIGLEGFGFEKDEDGCSLRIPHFGGIKIGNDVEIGALTSIGQGTIDPTYIGDNVKIDDSVFIAHNTKIGKRTYVIAQAEVSGSVEIGQDCWIGPSVCIRDGLKIGDNSILGMGSVVTKDVDCNMIVAGNPAQLIEDMKRNREVYKKILSQLS